MRGEDAGPLREAVLRWFEEAGRVLPWRETRDPYAILVAEVMLQQTQVERVTPKYVAFLRRFPTFEALAAASSGEVVREWGGLGYNRRALNLHRAARRVMARPDGHIPHDLRELESLPGVGTYTAAAVACFALGQRVPVLDTNSRRVLGRALFGASPPDGPSLVDAAWRALPEGDAWDWNQALMDLGAVICRARTPRCAECPARPHCRAAATFERAAKGVAEPRARYGGASEAFHGSRRYYRGRVVAWLRGLAEGEACDAWLLGREIKPGFAEGDRPWLVDLLRGLERDGLVALDEAPGDPSGLGVRLPAD